ncbi:hypothetical protein QBC47DRAFT_401802 [Echria macrotheca]|uniref:Uncharacterized protein n=1 Tax=Echria macrotheca TaxID=438768 RepID=A0AAJ0BD31_9PEZI|nr:hypothetical protein QBC47DRAFT_401802 [Echria macrotheca]
MLVTSPVRHPSITRETLRRSSRRWTTSAGNTSSASSSLPDPDELLVFYRRFNPKYQPTPERRDSSSFVLTKTFDEDHYNSNTDEDYSPSSSDNDDDDSSSSSDEEEEEEDDDARYTPPKSSPVVLVLKSTTTSTSTSASIINHDQNKQHPLTAEKMTSRWRRSAGQIYDGILHLGTIRYRTILGLVVYASVAPYLQMCGIPVTQMDMFEVLADQLAGHIVVQSVSLCVRAVVAYFLMRAFFTVLVLVF